MYRPTQVRRRQEKESLVAKETRLVVESSMKEIVSGFEGPEKSAMRSASDLGEALNAKVKSILEEAVQRAAANGRSTVRPCDL